MLTLSNLSEVYSGLPHHDSQKGEVRFFRLSDLTDVVRGKPPTFALGGASEVARATPIQSGDVILAARGVTTDLCTADERIVGAFISLDLYLVRPNTNLIDPLYLKTLLQLPDCQSALAAHKQGTALTRIPKEALEKLEIPLPALETQRKIAELAELVTSERRLLDSLTHSKTIYHREILARAVKLAMRAQF
jgi:Type I restriction modification DNA specificity domain